MSKRPFGSSRTHAAPSRRGYGQPVAEPSEEEYSGDIVGGPNSSDVAADDPNSLTIPTSHLIGFILASFAIIIVPGPSVLFTLARGIAWGRAVAVLTVVGNGLGMLLLSVLVAVGLGPLLSQSKLFTTVVGVAGGLYLLWLGADALRHRRAHSASMTDREAT